MRLVRALLALLITLAATACGQPTTLPQADPAQAPTTAASSGSAQADLDLIKRYLLEKSATLRISTLRLRQMGDEYYMLAEGANFDYRALEADLLGAEAQNRASALTRWITQVAAQLQITLE